jgi:hypothetical protein
MQAKAIIRFLIVALLIMLTLGCGKKGPPALPQEPTSLSKLKEHFALCPGAFGFPELKLPRQVVIPLVSKTYILHRGGQIDERST